MCDACCVQAVCCEAFCSRGWDDLALQVDLRLMSSERLSPRANFESLPRCQDQSLTERMNGGERYVLVDCKAALFHGVD